ncbi:MAG: transcriptional regulator, partial [Bacilli bacterium]
AKKEKKMDYEKLAKELVESIIIMNHPHKAPKDISKGEMGILVYLSFYKKEAFSGEIADKTNLSTGRVAIALNSLEKKGFVIRNKNTEDARQVIVSATSKGKAFAVKNKDDFIKHMTKLLEYIGETDATEYVRIRKKINSFDYEERKNHENNKNISSKH